MWKWNKVVVILGLLMISSSGIIAQNKKDLKKEQSKLRKDIKVMNGLMSENKGNQKTTEITYLLNIMRGNVRKELIKSINEEIAEVEAELFSQKNTIDSLKNQLHKFQEQYKKMILYAYKNRNATNNIIFVFSSENFNQAYKRLKYLKKIGEYREYQAKEIAYIQKNVQEKILKLEGKKEQKKRILGDKYYEINELKKEKEENKEVLKVLKKDEEKLKKKILQKQSESIDIDNKIKKIIEKEIAAAQERERKRKEKEKKEKRKKKKGDKTPNKTPDFGIAPPAAKLSLRFEQNKGKLPWPIKSGKISAVYGISKHPVFEHLKITNNGINMLTNEGADALAIFKGNVVAVIVLPSGGKSAILLQHGAYFTLYSNLKTVKVKKGQEIKLGQQLGMIKTEEDGKTEIHFELWKGNVKQNPAYWLRK
jgi:septal ring factor EnvC (AmiA/AmiB activator)